MSHYQYLKNGEPVDVIVDGKDGHFRVQVGGQELSLEAQKLSDHLLSVSANGKQKRIFVAESGGKAYVSIEGRIFVFDDAARASNNHGAGRSAVAVSGAITSPMPGNLIKVMVKEGDRVSEGQPLVIVEAMKMENEIRSPSEGIVKTIRYSVGDLVEAGVPIVELETEGT